MSPSLPPDGLDVLIVNFLCSFAAVTASLAILDVLMLESKIEAVTTALFEICAARIASSAIFAFVIASSSIETVPILPPNVSNETSFKFVPSA